MGATHYNSTGCTWLSWGSSLLSGANLAVVTFLCVMATVLLSSPPSHFSYLLKVTTILVLAGLVWEGTHGKPWLNLFCWFYWTAKVQDHSVHCWPKQLFAYRLIKQLPENSTSWDMLKLKPAGQLATKASLCRGYSDVLNFQKCWLSQYIYHFKQHWKTTVADSFLMFNF